MSIPDGGSAFPSPGKVRMGGNMAGDTWSVPMPDNLGMSIRDFFAAKAMQAYLIADVQQADNQIAVLAYGTADAMLAQRSKGTGT